MNLEDIVPWSLSSRKVCNNAPICLGASSSGTIW